MSSKVVKSLSVKFELLRLAVESGDIVLITGLPSTGKTTLAKRVLEEYPKYLNVTINCNNIATNSMLYLEILRLLHRELYQMADFKLSKQRVLNPLDFKAIYDRLRKQALKQKFVRVFVVLDQIELFKKTPMMEAIVFLTSEPGLDFIMISGENGFDLLDGIQSNNYKLKFQDRLSIVETNAWSKEDLIDSILEQLPSESTGLYKKFVHNVVNTVYNTNTKDFVELRSFCQENFPDFLEYYKRKVHEMLKRSGEEEEIDLEDVDFDVEEDVPSSLFTANIGTFLGSFKDLIRKGEVREWGKLVVDRKVVLHTAALIIAAYVAAYTRRVDDKKNFISYQKRISKRTKQEHSDNDPKAFTMERLIQVYRGIIILLDNLKEDSRVARHDSVLSDIQLLQDLDLISIITGDGLDAQTRYKISHHVSHHYVRMLSQSISFEIDSLTGIPVKPK